MNMLCFCFSPTVPHRLPEGTHQGDVSVTPSPASPLSHGRTGLTPEMYSFTFIRGNWMDWVMTRDIVDCMSRYPDC